MVSNCVLNSFFSDAWPERLDCSKAAFPWDVSMWNRNNWVRIALAFPQEKFHLELVCNKSNRDAKEARQSLFFELRTSIVVHFLPGPIWDRWTRFQEYGSNWDLIQKQTHLEPISSPKWNIPYSPEACPYQECHDSKMNRTLGSFFQL